MTYLKITLLFILTFSINTTANSNTQNEANDPPHENHIFSDLTAFFTDTSQLFAQYFDDWFESSPAVESEKYHNNPPSNSVATQLNKPKKNIEININEKISKLEERRLAIEERRLAAEEKRLIATEKRLAAAEQRLAAEEERLAVEEQKMLTRETSKLLALPNTNNHPSQIENENRLEQKTLLLASKKKMEKVEQKKLTSVVSTTKNPAFIKLENQYYLDLYKWELITETYRLVKYPDWAKSLGKKGNVKLNFTVSRNTRVSKVNGDNPNISIQLITELHRAIITAAKLVLPPDALPGNSWDMSIAYNFHPNNNQQAVIQKPSKPLFLEREDSTVLISSDNNLTKYQEEIKDIISDRIEYPVWAEKLNQKGNVSFEIVINKDGSIAGIVPKEVNRHSFLNQEVLKAINDSAPLPSIPEHLRLQSTNMIIQHDFKNN